MRVKRERPQAPDWTALLIEAVQKPGTLSTAYRQFWNYSVGNQLLAFFECLRRGLTPGPIHTFRGWNELGRYVKKGEKAITLCMPVQVKQNRRTKDDGKILTPSADQESLDKLSDTRTIFVYKPHWFVLSQTDGQTYVPTELPAWSESLALHNLKIARITFDYLDGNCQGFARNRKVSVSPIAVLPHKTLFHEIAHVMLEHTVQGALEDRDDTPRSLREVEAEAVALICCESLDLPGAAECRGYIQHWLSGKAIIPDQSVPKILKAADAILKSGYPPASTKK